MSLSNCEESLVFPLIIYSIIHLQRQCSTLCCCLHWARLACAMAIQGPSIQQLMIRYCKIETLFDCQPVHPEMGQPFGNLPAPPDGQPSPGYCTAGMPHTFSQVSSSMSTRILINSGMARAGWVSFSWMATCTPQTDKHKANNIVLIKFE